MWSVDRLEARTRVPWARVVVLGAVSAAGFVGALAMATAEGPGTGFAAFVLGALAIGLGWVAYANARPARMVLTQSGIELHGTRSGTYAWDEVEGLGALRYFLPGVPPFNRFHVYLCEGDDLILTSNWLGCAEVLGSLQAARFDPGARFDEYAAFHNAPRSDAASVLGTDAAQVARFARAAVEGFEEAGVTARVSARRLQAVTDQGIFELFSIARVCLAADESAWTETIADHVRGVRAVRRAASELFEQARSIDDVRARLAVQLIPKLDADAHHVSRELPGTELREALVVDLDGGEGMVPEGVLSKWGETPDRAFALARENFSSAPALARRELEHSPVVLFSGSRAAARATDPGSLVEIDRRFGAIVAFPAQDAALVLPLHDAADLLQLSLGPLAPVFDEIRAHTPRPLGGVFWWHRGTFTPVPRVLTPSGVQWIVPDGLSGRLVGRIADDQA
jgi:hypothetical protein